MAEAVSTLSSIAQYMYAQKATRCLRSMVFESKDVVSKASAMTSPSKACTWLGIVVISGAVTRVKFPKSTMKRLQLIIIRLTALERRDDLLLSIIS